MLFKDITSVLNDKIRPCADWGRLAISSKNMENTQCACLGRSFIVYLLETFQTIPAKRINNSSLPLAAFVSFGADIRSDEQPNRPDDLCVWCDSMGRTHTHKGQRKTSNDNRRQNRPAEAASRQMKLKDPDLPSSFFIQWHMQMEQHSRINQRIFMALLFELRNDSSLASTLRSRFHLNSNNSLNLYIEFCLLTLAATF